MIYATLLDKQQGIFYMHFLYRQHITYHSLWWTSCRPLVARENGSNCKCTSYQGSIGWSQPLQASALPPELLHALHLIKASLYILFCCFIVTTYISRRFHVMSRAALTCHKALSGKLYSASSFCYQSNGIPYNKSLSPIYPGPPTTYFLAERSNVHPKVGWSCVLLWL